MPALARSRVVLTTTYDAGAAAGGGPPTVTNGALGADLGNCQSYRIIVSADAGQLLTGAGDVRVWVWSPSLSRWCKDPDLDWLITPAGSTWVNCRDRSLYDLDPAPFGRVFPEPHSIGVDAGNVTVSVETLARE